MDICVFGSGAARINILGEPQRIKGHFLKGCMAEIRQIFYVLGL